MKSLAVVLVVCMSSGSMAGMMGLTMEMKDMMNTYNLYATCLGPGKLFLMMILQHQHFIILSSSIGYGYISIEKLISIEEK